VKNCIKNAQKYHQKSTKFIQKTQKIKKKALIFRLCIFQEYVVIVLVGYKVSWQLNSFFAI
jgi:hypothetical protein